MSTERSTIQTYLESREFMDKVIASVMHVLLWIAVIIAAFPFVWAFFTSLKPPDQVIPTANMLFPTRITLENYVSVIQDLMMDRWLMNSLIFATGAVVITVTVDSLAGYALAKGNFRGQKLMYTLVISMLIIPPQVLVIPLFIEISYLNLADTYWAMMLLYIANPFGTFMMRQFFISVPDNLIDAAIMDGCNKLQIFTKVLLPMAKPPITALTIFTFVISWNTLLWPLIVAQRGAMFPVQVGIAQLLGGPFDLSWGLLITAALVAAMPVFLLYLITQEAFMTGVAMLGTKQ